MGQAIDLWVCIGYYINVSLYTAVGGFLKHTNMTITQRTNVFFKEVWVELKRVSWLSRNDVLRYTGMVLAVTIIVAGFLGGLDFIFTEALKYFILK
jgi:preprotein translocase subunit SecE